MIESFTRDQGASITTRESELTKPTDSMTSPYVRTRPPRRLARKTSPAAAEHRSDHQHREVSGA